MTFEEFCETLIYIGKITGSVGAMLKCAQYFIECCKNVREYYEEKPEDKLERLKDKLSAVRKEYQQVLDQRKKGIIAFFEKIPDEEKARRKEEDTYFKEEKNKLKDEIALLEKKLGYDQICILQ